MRYYKAISSLRAAPLREILFADGERFSLLNVALTIPST